MLYTEQILQETITDSEILMDLETLIPEVSEILILVASEMEMQEALEMETRTEDSETPIPVVSEIQIQEDSVIQLHSNNQDITMEVSDPVIQVDLETVADLIIPVVVSDLAVHLAVAASEVVHPAEAVDLDPVASDNIQLHKKLLKK